MKECVSEFALFHTGYNFQKQFASTLPDLRLWEEMIYVLQEQKIFSGKICTVFCHCEIALDVQVLTINFIKMFCSFNSIELFHTDSCLFFSSALDKSFSDMILKICEILAPLYYFV